jgi:oligopeptide transport system ATP-binding protein
MPLLEVRDLKVHFPVRHSVIERGNAVVKAVDGVNLSVEPGETVGLVGESGCGKSTLGRAVIGLVKPTAGEVFFDGAKISALSKNEFRKTRRHLQIIFQDPVGSLNPRMTVRQILSEPLDIHKLAPSREERATRIAELLENVGLAPNHADRYPHEFSGGQRQRIGIARALAVEPRLIICDEPVSALDVSIQAQIINLLQDLQSRLGIAYLFIAHDLAVVEHISQRILVMYLGRIVESGNPNEVVNNPRHPYTRALISAVPKLTADESSSRIVLKGEIPSPIKPPSGCPFHTRCPIAEFPRCSSEVPEFREVATGHRAACHFA